MLLCLMYRLSPRAHAYPPEAVACPLSPRMRRAPRRPGRARWSPWNHPRVCGEHALQLRDDVHRHGIIPAYAGSTLLWIPLLPAARDHPRVCGEHGARDVRIPARAGIIPAYAGSTSSSISKPTRAPGSSPRMRGAPIATVSKALAQLDHPRVCGEHSKGSPATGRLQGIIPAYAGSTLLSPSHQHNALGSSPRMRGARAPGAACRQPRWDHPRVCGEHSFHGPQLVRVAWIIPAYAGSTALTWSVVATRAGSSPRMRGAPICCVSDVPLTRDHPRVCGEHPSELMLITTPDGIIPAYAGSTWCSRSVGVVVRGSSPRMRGALAGDLGTTDAP